MQKYEKGQPYNLSLAFFRLRYRDIWITILKHLLDKLISSKA